MPPVVPVRELSVTEVNQIQHKRNVIMIAGLAIVFIGAFFISLRDLSPAYTVGIIFLLGFFLLSFINIRFGFVLIILAFLLSPEIDLPFSQYRGFTIRTEDTLIIILMLAWLGRLAMGVQKNLFIKTPLNMPILAIVIWNIICSFRAISSGWVDVNFCIFTNLKIIEFFAIYFLIVNNLNDIKEVKFVLYVLLITALVVGVYAALQIPKTEIFTSNRLTAPFEGKPEPNTLGAYLAIFFGMALSLFIYSKAGGLRRLSGALLLLLPFPIMFSFARSAYYATLGITVALAIISRKKWLIATLIILAILSPFILPKVVIERAFYNFFVDNRYYGFMDQSLGERFFAFQKAWGYVKAYPIFGGGITAAGGILDSQYARNMIETGLIGLSLFFWLIIRLFKMGLVLFNNSADWIKGVGVGFLVVIIGLLIHSFGNITFYIVRIAEPFWALAALVAYLFLYNQSKLNNQESALRQN
jgi:O-antigen ligase